MAACFADLGHKIVSADIDAVIVDTINAGTAPIHEAGLPERVAEHVDSNGMGRLEATTKYDAVLDTDVTFLCLLTATVSIFRL